MFIPGFHWPEVVPLEFSPALVTGHIFCAVNFKFSKLIAFIYDVFKMSSVIRKFRIELALFPLFLSFFPSMDGFSSIMKARCTLLTQPIRCIEP